MHFCSMLTLDGMGVFITKDVTVGFNAGESLLLKINVLASCII